MVVCHERCCAHGIMLTQKGIVSTSDFMCAEAHEIMVYCVKVVGKENTPWKLYYRT